MPRATTRRRERRGSSAGKQPPWRRYRNPYRPLEVLSVDQVEAIHEASLRILEEQGIEFLDEQALEILKAAGAEVAAGSQRVRFDRGLVLDSVAKTPSEAPLPARTPTRPLTFGGTHTHYDPLGS